jgi:hypothetical protein
VVGDSITGINPITYGKELIAVRSSANDSWKGWTIAAVVLAVIVIILGALWWFIFDFWSDSDARTVRWFWHIFLERSFFPGGSNPLHFTWLAWLCGCIVAIIVACIFASSDNDNIALGGGAACGAAAFIMFVLFCYTLVINLNDYGAAYAGSTTFVVEDTKNPPSSLRRLVKDTVPDQHGCALYAHNDMRGCINQGTFDFDWNARVASVTGATIVMQRSSGGVPNTKLLSDTLTYVYDEDGSGTWTAIRDGKSKQPIYGVTSWNGQGNATTTCTFRGQYSLKKAFGGRWGTNLADNIASKYPNLFYDSGDRYGYCEGERPVIIIPVKEQIAFRQRIAFRSAGVLVITGSPSGKAQYKHVEDVKPGDYPGPVYPASLAKDQRESMGTIAGLGDHLFGKFGYEPTDSITQLGNSSEYQLRDKATGRIYWVTPMKPRGSDDRVLAAYAVTPADEATKGSLNEQRIYVLPDGDVRAVNLDDLESRTRQAISETGKDFFSSGGQLAEFLPIGRGMWQVYAELNDRVAFRIAIPSDSRIKPTITDLDDPEDGLTGESVMDSACKEDLRRLSDKDLVRCLSDAADELEARQNP